MGRCGGPKACCVGRSPPHTVWRWRLRWSRTPVGDFTHPFCTMLRRPLLRTASTKGGVDPSMYLHRSILPSYYFQDSLPSLPVPTLDVTLQRYLRSLSPLITPEALARTTAIVKDFQSGDGLRLNAKLHENVLANPRTSYISEDWFDMYLTTRDPLPLNLNPQLTWRNDSRPRMQSQCARAANIVHASVRFHLTLSANLLEPEVYHMKPAQSRDPTFLHALLALTPRSVATYPMYALSAYPLDMSQYSRLFASTRIPHLGKDELYTSPTPSTHIIVAHGSELYRVEVVEEGSGTPVPMATLEARLAGIVGAGKGNPYAYPPTPPVGALTTLHRDAWAAERGHLTALSPTNAASLHAIDTALFFLSLDEAAPTNHEDLSRTMLHGACRNRWFDKCLNIVVAENGRAGVSWEHAWGDGVAVLNFFNAVHEAMEGAPELQEGGPVSTPPDSTGVRPLAWELDDRARAAIGAAHASATSPTGLCGGVALKVYQTDSLNKEDIKRSGLSPDGVMQMALQLAHWRVHVGAGNVGGVLPATYESASTAAYKHGRTETIRSATPEAKAMAVAFAATHSGAGGGNASSTTPSGIAAQRFAALSAATEKHRGLTIEGVQGQGCDRHLFALRVLAERPGVLGVGRPAALPPLFADPSYSHFTDIRLSTSTMASSALDGGGFGPVNDHSYAVSYGVEERGCHFHIMCRSREGGGKANGAYAGAVSKAFEGDLDPHAFAEAVEQALRDIVECASIVKGFKPRGGSGGFSVKR